MGGRREIVNSFLIGVKRRPITATEWRWLQRACTAGTPHKKQAFAIIKHRKHGGRRRRRGW